MAKADSGRWDAPTRRWPKLPQSTWACSPGSTSTRRYTLRALGCRTLAT
jgi:hypothetical protein